VVHWLVLVIRSYA